jgi:predicted permease
MSWMKQIFARRRLYGELSQEIRAHIAEKVEELVARGMARKDAEAAARREFGNVMLTEEDAREVWRWPMVEGFLMDVRYGLRMLRKNPGFSAVAVLTIALGIGANAAIFGLVDSAILNALPFAHPDRLVHIWTTDDTGDTHTPLPQQYLALRKFSQSFQQIAANGWTDNFYGSDESGWQSLQGLLVTANWLSTLRVQPYLGRDFLGEEEAAGRDDVVMLAYSFWRSRFHGDEHIIGKKIVLNRRPVTVVAILPPSLSAYPEYEYVQTIAPLLLDSYQSVGSLRVAGTARVRIVGRLKDGVTLAQARAETEAIAAGLRGPTAANDKAGHLVVEDFGDEVRNPGPTRQNALRGLLLMAATAGVVLLIACANVAALLLARGLKRQREVAVRAAIGCSRGRMIRQLLTESLLLFLGGAGLGLFAAKWSEELITKAASGLISSVSYVNINARVLGIGLAVALVSALIFGMIPALQMTRVNLNDSLKDGVSKVTSGAGLRRPRNLLLVFQIALGMVLMVGFGLLLRSLLHVESSPLGFDPHNVLTATVSLPVPHYADLASKARVMKAAVEQVRAMPGVESAGIVDSLPMDGADGEGLKIETPGAKTVEEETWFLSVGPEYFSALRIPMLAGRAFGERDDQSGGPVAIVNQTFAKTYFAGGNPVGYHVAFSSTPATWREIVGVVSDFKQRNPEEDLRPLVYLPIAQTFPAHWSMVVRMRASSDMATAAHEISSALRPIDPQLYWRMGSIQEQIHDSESLTLRRPIITLLASFGGLALVLIVVGVFGVTSYFVAERTREIGVRVALGASGREVMGLVLRESLGVALAGLGVGTVAAYGLARLLPTRGIGWSGSGIFLYGVSRTDWLTYSFAALLLTLVVVMATWKPARRAMRVDPMVALRYE